MKIEFNPDPAIIKWLVLALLIISGAHYEELMLLVGM